MIKRLICIGSLCAAVLLITHLAPRQTVHMGYDIPLGGDMTMQNNSVYADGQKIAEIAVYPLDDEDITRLQESRENQFADMKNILEECTESLDVSQSSDYSIGESVYADFEAHFTISDPVLGILEYQHYYSMDHDYQLHDLVIIKPLATDEQQQLLLTGLTI